MAGTRAGSHAAGRLVSPNPGTAFVLSGLTAAGRDRPGPFAADAPARACDAGTGLAGTGLAGTGLADTGLADTALADTALAAGGSAAANAGAV